MAKQAYIFDVTEDNFDTLVVENSAQMPVVVAFINAGTESQTLAQDLSHFAQTFAQQFVFAKVNVDEQTELAGAFELEQTPTTVIFINGEIQNAKQGVISPEDIALMLRQIGVYDPVEEMRLEAHDKYMAGDPAGAVALLTQAIQLDPSRTLVALDMVQIMLDLDQIEGATSLFNKLPDEAKQSQVGRNITSQMTFKQLAANTPGLVVLSEQLETNPQDHEGRFNLAICHIANLNFEEAMTHLFELQTSQPDFQNGAPKETIITLCNLITATDPALAKRYRQQLNNLLN